MRGAPGATGGVTVAGGIARGRVRDIGASRSHHALQKGDLENGGGMRGTGDGSDHMSTRITNELEPRVVAAILDVAVKTSTIGHGEW